MQTISRRAVVSGLAVVALCRPARAGIPEQLSVDADEGPVALTRYAADRAAKRPASCSSTVVAVRTQAPRLRALRQRTLGEGY
jgi:hypothetical protein